MERKLLEEAGRHYPCHGRSNRCCRTEGNSNEHDINISGKWRDTHDDSQRAWQAVVERFVDREPSSSSPSILLQRLEEGIGQITKPGESPQRRVGDGLSVEQVGKQREEMASRLRRELEDIEFRLNQGLERCDQFWEGNPLLRCRHGQWRTIFLNRRRLEAPLEVYSRALKQNKTTTHIAFFDFDSDDDHRWIADTIRDLLWVTWISVPDPNLLPAIDRTTPLFVSDHKVTYGSDIQTFLENDPQLAHSQDTFIFQNWNTLAVSFMGPTSGNLILRLRHRSNPHNRNVTVRGTSFQLSLSPFLTVDDITLHASPSKSDKLSFERGIRNNLIIQVRGGSQYALYDIWLLDETGNRYNAASQSSESVFVSRCVDNDRSIAAVDPQ